MQGSEIHNGANDEETQTVLDEAHCLALIFDKAASLQECSLTSLKSISLP